MKRTILFLFLSFMLMANAACAAVFNGTVLDAGTGGPLEGAVVVMSWSEETATPAGPSQRVKDVKEALTDKDGRWTIEGPKGKRPDIEAFALFATGTYMTLPPEFIVFKPGYCPYPRGYFIEACKGMSVNGEHFGNVGNGEALALPRLTEREDRRKTYPGPIDWAESKNKRIELLRKQKNFIRLINQEMRYLGFDEYDYDFLQGDSNNDE